MINKHQTWDYATDFQTIDEDLLFIMEHVLWVRMIWQAKLGLTRKKKLKI